MSVYSSTLNLRPSERGHLPELRNYTCSKDIPEVIFNIKALVTIQHIREAQTAGVIANMAEDDTQWFIEFCLWMTFS